MRYGTFIHPKLAVTTISWIYKKKLQLIKGGTGTVLKKTETGAKPFLKEVSVTERPSARGIILSFDC